MTLIDILRTIKDERGTHGRRYGLSSILGLIILRKFCGRNYLTFIAKLVEQQTRKQNPFRLL